MRSRFCLLVACLLLPLAALRASATEIYSVFYDNRLGVIDDSTGAFTQLGTLPVAQSAGIADDDGLLYVLGIDNELAEVDPTSGAAAIVGGGIVGGGSSGSSSVGFAGGNNGLFDVDSMSNLYSINPVTGAATLVGATGLPANYGGWDTSLSDDGTYLYFTAGGAGANDELYRINPATGIATDLGSTGVSGIAGSAVVNGFLELFQYNSPSGQDHIYSAPLGMTDFEISAVLDAQIVDGGTLLGLTGISVTTDNLSTPEPFSALLLGAGLLGLWFWRRRIKLVTCPSR